METLRTPDERFAGLPDWSWEPHYAEVRADGDAVRMAYVDEGPAQARPVLLLHGEPSWSYLYRDDPVAARRRGCGCRSLDRWASVARTSPPPSGTTPTHYTGSGSPSSWWATSTCATRFCSAMGGLLGLRLVAEHPDRFVAVVASNTFLPDGLRDPRR